MPGDGEARRKVGAVERATRAELRARSVSVQAVGLAAAAVLMARQLDAGCEPKDAATVANALRAALVEVAKAYPLAPVEMDVVDELRARRKARRGA